MKTTPLTEIAFSNRQRKNIDRAKIEELASSIAEKGLFHPIVCIETPGGLLKLVAGERRKRAVEFLSEKNMTYSHDNTLVPPGEIPYILINSDLDDIQIREAELEENIFRVDLTWQDKVAALDELHQLRLAQNPKQSIAATAREIVDSALDSADGAELPRGLSSKQTERELDFSLLIAEHLDDPEVSNATSLTQAHRIVSKKMEAELSLELVKRGAEHKTVHTLIEGDFTHITVIEKLPKDFSCIIADPPYGIGADQFGDAAQHAHTYEDTEATALDFARRVFVAGFGLTLPDAHLYLFCDVEYFLTLRELGKSFSWNVWRTPLIWHKTSSSAHAPLLTRGFRRTYELILFASKGDKPFSQVYPDVILAASPHTKDVAAQKPVELYETFLNRSCLPGDKVLDPCCGSGTIFQAAETLHLEAWGVEKDPSAYAIAHLNLSELGEGNEH